MQLCGIFLKSGEEYREAYSLMQIPDRSNQQPVKRYWDGKCAVVTGAASGIGLALAKALIDRNRALIIVPARAGMTALVYRLVPGLVHAIGRQVIAAELQDRPKDATQEQYLNGTSLQTSSGSEEL